MPSERAECLIFIPKDEERLARWKRPRQSRTAQNGSRRWRGYVLLPATFVDEHPEVARLFKQSFLRVVYNEHVPRLPAPHSELDVVEILLDDRPEASVDPLSVISDYPDPDFISQLICKTHVNLEHVQKPSEVRPAVDMYNRRAFKHLITRNFEIRNYVYLTVDSGGILHLASMRGDEVMVRTMLDNGVEVNSTTGGGSAALHLAVRSGSVPTVKRLLDRGARLEKTDSRGCTSLHIACHNRPKEIVQLLLDRGADVNAITADRSTPLHIACQESLKEIVQLLLGRGADVNATTADRSTPLHIACQENHKEIVQLLLERGADVNAMTAARWTPLHFAAKKRKPEIALLEILLDHGAQFDERCQGQPILQPANIEWWGCCFDHVKFLVEYCLIDPKLLSVQSRSLLHDSGNRQISTGSPSEKYDRKLFAAEHMVKIMALHNLKKLPRVSLADTWHSLGLSPSEIREECDLEVALMESQELGDTGVSMRDALLRDEYRVSRLLKNPSTSRAIDRDILKDRFPLYGNILYHHFRKGQHRAWLQSEGIKSFNLLMRFFQKFPDEIVEEIVGFLENVDILKLRRASGLENGPENE